MKIDVEKKSLRENKFFIKNINEEMKDDLTDVFYDAFENTVEYIYVEKDQVRKQAVKNIEHYFANKREIAQPQLSFAAFSKENNSELLGACLVSKYKFGYKDEIIFVRSDWQNCGIGSLLMQNVINSLADLEIEEFWSEHHICNGQSRMWHLKFGFKEVTDITVARLRRAFFAHEVYRHEKLGNSKELKASKKLLKDSESKLDELIELEEKEGFDAAWMMWRYDF